jgi:hypothetical protein
VVVLARKIMVAVVRRSINVLDAGCMIMESPAARGGKTVRIVWNYFYKQQKLDLYNTTEKQKKKIAEFKYTFYVGATAVFNMMADMNKDNLNKESMISVLEDLNKDLVKFFKDT